MLALPLGPSLAQMASLVPLTPPSCHIPTRCLPVLPHLVWCCRLSQAKQAAVVAHGCLCCVAGHCTASVALTLLVVVQKSPLQLVRPLPLGKTTCAAPCPQPPKLWPTTDAHELGVLVAPSGHVCERKLLQQRLPQ